jgi:6-phosphogluconolactonase
MRRFSVLALAVLASACSTDESSNGTPAAGGSDAAPPATGGSAGAGGGAGSGGRNAGGSLNGGSSGTGGSAAGGGAGNGGSSGGGANGGSSGSAGAGGSTGGASGGSSGTGGATGTGGSSGAATTGFVYVGSGDFSGPNGAVTLYRFDYQTAALTQVDRVPVGGLASFLAIDAPHSALFAADEADGNLRMLSLDATTHAPSHATPSSTPTAGHPVHVTATSDGRFVLVAHYNEGKAESFGVQNGALTASLDVESPGSQAHAAVLAPDERFAFVPCKGSNRIARFSFDAATGALSPLTAVNTQAGDGPRHMAFHPNGKYAYVINENSSSVIAYAYTAADGSLSELMRTTSLPPGFSGTSTGAEIAVEPSGRFLYASNRYTGANGDIVAFAINAADGRISAIGHQSTGGRTPRSFSIDPTGRFLFVGNQGSNTVGVLAIDGATGALGSAKTTDVGVTPYFVGAAPFTQ